MEKNSKADFSKCAQIASSCTCFGLRKASRAITQKFDAHLASAGVTTSQFQLLNAAMLAKNMPLSELAKILVMDRTTLARSLKPLLNAGFIALCEGQDKRVKIIQLTDKGLSVLLKAIPLWEKVQEETKQRLGKANWKDLMEKLNATVAIAVLN